MREPTPRDVSINYHVRMNLQTCESPMGRDRFDRWADKKAVTVFLMKLLDWDPTLFDGGDP